MSISTQIPISCVRSTAYEVLSIGERRHRPKFSLQLDANITLAFEGTRSQSATPDLSPAASSVASPTLRGTPLFEPTTPMDIIDHWPGRSSSSNGVSSTLG
jgi:hypothetical protein